LRVFSRMNQLDGFDCPSCAWPDPQQRTAAEFCENGAKAVSLEATRKKIGAEFFGQHSIAELRQRDDFWLSGQGRLTEPMVRRSGASHYEPISWTEALALIATKLRSLPNPHDAVFYTSGRTSNEAAFLYQALVRAYGTNNLPDCSNMCHESSGKAMISTIGIGKGAVTVESLEQAKLIVIMGQNPGTNAPRMLTHLAAAKARGARIIAINPLPEAGLIAFKNPQKFRGLLGSETPIADDYVQIRLGGDKALLQGVAALLLAAEGRAPGTVLDREFLNQSTAGFADYERHLQNIDWSQITAATGLARSDIQRIADAFIDSPATTVCWAMGLTQHLDAVATIREIINLLLLQGNIGKPGAGPCPVRGHSNVQGDRTMGINENAPREFLDAVARAFGYTAHYEPGVSASAAIARLAAGQVRVFFALGGNFAQATPDTPLVHRGLEKCELTVQVSTTLNASHLVTGDEALILPVLGRTDLIETPAGPQVITVEDSQGQVRASRGRLRPPSANLLAEPTLVARLAEQLLAGRPGGSMPWSELASDFDAIRDLIADVVPGFANFNARLRDDPRGFLLPHGPRDSRTFATASGRAQFTRSELVPLTLPPGRLLLQTIRSHDQFNTTIYGQDDRYRGISHGRRVVLVHPEDLHGLGLHDGS
ncbi:MAG: FdhF/YdeP family oxidoreductase, partial [Angustibacter sp.]